MYNTGYQYKIQFCFWTYRRKIEEEKRLAEEAARIAKEEERQRRLEAGEEIPEEGNFLFQMSHDLQLKEF